MRPMYVLTAALVAAGVTVAGAASAGTLEDVKARGVLRCVVSTGIAGFAYPDAKPRRHREQKNSPPRHKDTKG